MNEETIHDPEFVQIAQRFFQFIGAPIEFKSGLNYIEFDHQGFLVRLSPLNDGLTLLLEALVISSIDPAEESFFSKAYSILRLNALAQTRHGFIVGLTKDEDIVISKRLDKRQLDGESLSKEILELLEHADQLSRFWERLGELDEGSLDESGTSLDLIGGEYLKA